MEQIAAFLRERRQALALTQADAADLAGVSQRFVRSVESGKTSVQLDKLLALAEVLGVELRPVLRGSA